jgi:hypothetical protein
LADSHPAGDEADDAARWWRAYVLAENGQVDELRKSAARGDDHARRQLADLLGDRDRIEEAIEAIRPLADAGDDVADLWLARWLADRDDLDELRQRADGGSYHASRELATRLAEHDRYDELRERASASGGDYALCELAGWLAQRDMHRELRELAVSADPDRRQLILEAAGAAHPGSVGGMDVLRVLADLGNKRGRAFLARRLAQAGHLDELRERAASGDEYAQDWLEEALGQL